MRWPSTLILLTSLVCMMPGCSATNAPGPIATDQPEGLIKVDVGMASRNCAVFASCKRRIDTEWRSDGKVTGLAQQADTGCRSVDTASARSVMDLLMRLDQTINSRSAMSAGHRHIPVLAQGVSCRD